MNSRHACLLHRQMKGFEMGRGPKVTWESVKNLIESGRGAGFGEGYRPLLEIRRWNPSPMSVQVVKPLPPFKRKCHFFSHSEWYLALLLSWLGATIREQFPMWPWAHPHPEYGRNIENDRYLPWSGGMQEICRTMGIDHGVFVGTDIPYIWTIDLCLYMPWVNDPLKACCFVSVKALESEKYLCVDPLHRGVEKLEAERRYAMALGIPYFTGDRTLFPGKIFANLEYLAESAILPESHPWNSTLWRFLDKQSEDLFRYPLQEIKQRLSCDYGASEEEATFLVNHMLWHQLIDCDPSYPIKMTVPARPGGRKLQENIRRSLEGGENV